MAISKVSAYSLSKKFLQDNIFPKYPEIANKIKQTSEVRYDRNVRSELTGKRLQHVMEINKQSPYKAINITDKRHTNQ